MQINKIKKITCIIKCFVRIFFTSSNIQFYIKWSNRLLFSTTRKGFSSEKQIFILVPRPDTYLDSSDRYLKKLKFDYFYQYKYYLEYNVNYNIINKLCVDFKIKNFKLQDKNLFTLENVHSILDSKSKKLCNYKIFILNTQSENENLIQMFNTNIIFIKIKNPINLKYYNFDNLVSYYPVVDGIFSDSEKEIEFNEYNYESDYVPIEINCLQTSLYMIGLQKEDKFLKSWLETKKVSLNDQQFYYIISDTVSSNFDFISPYFNIFLSSFDENKSYIPSFN